MSDTPKIILASKSPRRLELLEKYGVNFVVYVSNCEEITECLEPAEVVKDLSFQKARAVFSEVEMLRAGDERYADTADADFILAADTVVAVDEMILGKPENEDRARWMLKLISGRAHQVYTGVCVLDRKSGETVVSFAHKTEVYVEELSETEIAGYIATGEPMDKAGAYGIQGLFGIYIKAIEGDYENVVGLPMARVYQELKKQGIQLCRII